MNHAAEKESAAIASLIIFRSDSCRDAFFSPEEEKTYDRSFEHFAALVAKRLV